MVPADELKSAQELMQVFQRARKNLRIYPVNNPIYSRTIEEAFKKTEDYLEQFGDIDLKIKQNEILMNGKNIYQSAEKDDNFAFFFFKDGLRELRINRGLNSDELREFLRSISYDFERLEDEEDVVTLLWEKDFEHIKYVIDDKFLLEDESYENQAVARAMEETTEEADLKKAHQDAENAETEQRTPQIVPVTTADLNQLVKEIEQDTEDKVPKLMEILFDLYFDTSLGGSEEVLKVINDALEFSIQNENIHSALYILRMAKKYSDDISFNEAPRKGLRQVFTFASSLELIKVLGERLDAGTAVQEDILSEYVQYLEKEAIPPFISVLGDLKSIEARKVFINALAFLGGKDINTLAKGLSDPRWYIVRNIIYIFRRIGDRRAVEFLVRAAYHHDTRVRMEAIKALGELGGQGVIQTVKDALDDPESSIRATATRALGMIKTEPAKKIIMGRIATKEFLDIDFNEKKEYFEMLANWKDRDTIDFLMKTLKSTSLLKKGKYDEMRACAAFSLGLIGHKEALSQLHKIRDSKNKLLSEYAYTAIKRIEYGG